MTNALAPGIVAGILPSVFIVSFCLTPTSCASIRKAFSMTGVR